MMYRPLNNKEINEGQKNVVTVDPDRSDVAVFQRIGGKAVEKKYSYDKVNIVF